MRLLIVGTLKGQLITATKLAMERGARVVHAKDCDAALHTLRSGQSADLLMVDVEEDIADLINRLATEHIHAPVIACGVQNDAHAAVKAIRAGAKEYIPLPPDPDIIAAILAAVTEESHVMIQHDETMGRIVRLADQIATSDASILITGESGTGKEVMARYIHRQSKRADKPFISVNCAAIPEALLESELFGHEKGAFTGAIARRIGKFEEANHGTLLLDEISEMDIRLQAKLLRAIQERMIDRVGGGKPIPLNIRIIATSNRDLVEAVRDGTFRQDLLYRLNVVNLKIPPLRDRPGDILKLAVHFVRKYSQANGLPPRMLSREARAQLTSNSWPGNVRELENTIHRAVLLTDTEQIDSDAIRTPDGMRLDEIDPETSVNDRSTDEEATHGLVGQTVAQVERNLILDTLQHCLGNRTHAANILGISIRTLRNKLKQYSESGSQAPGLDDSHAMTSREWIGHAAAERVT